MPARRPLYLCSIREFARVTTCSAYAKRTKPSFLVAFPAQQSSCQALCQKYRVRRLEVDGADHGYSLPEDGVRRRSHLAMGCERFVY